MRAVNKILLSLDKPFQDEIISPNGLKLFLDTRFRPEWNATSIGTVASIPSRLSNYGLNVGDEVCFSFSVVESRTFTAIDGSTFYPTKQPNPVFMEYINANGHRLIMGSFKKSNTFTEWYASAQDQHMNVIDGIQGSEERILNFMSQFKIGHYSSFTFDNLIEVDGEKYWQADLYDIFAKRVNGKLVAINDRILCKAMNVYGAKKGGIIDLKHSDKEYGDRGKVLYDDEILGVKKDDVVAFSPMFCEKYNFWGEDYLLIQRDLINSVII